MERHKKSEYVCEKCNRRFLRRPDVQKRSGEVHGCVACLSCGRKLQYEKNTAFQNASIKAREKSWKLKHERGVANRVTINCRCCQKEFEVPYGKRDRLYCSRSCQAKSVVRPPSKKVRSECIECKKVFEHYGSRIVCSRACNATYSSKQRVGESNPAYKERIRCKCLGCGKDFSYGRDGMGKDRVRKYCSFQCFIGNPGSNELSTTRKQQYPKEFSKELRECVRDRFGRKCFLCGLDELGNKEKHSVHHIDYNKNNVQIDNLVPLCRRCHSKTNGGEGHFWRTLFSVTLSGSRIVPKKWGFEVHVVNHDEYCLKYLVLFKDCYFSNHYHTTKKELWHCLVGQFEVALTDVDEKQECFILTEGEKLEVPRKVVHQIRALKHSILTEVSTQSFAEDSYKDYPSLLGD